MSRTAARVRIAAVVGLILAGWAIPTAGAVAALPEPSVSPTITPKVWHGEVNCPTGRLCAYVLTNRAGHTFYDGFDFYHCRTYTLHYWHSWGIVQGGFVYDNQTGGVTTTLYDRNGRVLQRIKPSRDKQQYVLPTAGGWDQVYSIKVC